MSELHDWPIAGDFGGRCLAGPCSLNSELLLPSSTFLGLRKEGSFLYGTWRDEEGNLLRALRGVSADSSTMRWVFASSPGRQLERDDAAEATMWSGPAEIMRAGRTVTFTSVGAQHDGGFTFVHAEDECSWTDASVLDVHGHLLAPAAQWFSSWGSGACYSVSAKYRSSGQLLGRRVEGFIGHEIHYFSDGTNWWVSPFGAGREICWQQVANEYADGSTVHGTFAYGNDGWGFAMLQDEDGRFHCSTDVVAEATVTSTGYPASITYRFAGQTWTWRIDPQGERAQILPGSPLRGADGTALREGDPRPVRLSMGNTDWWTDGRADRIVTGGPVG